MDQALRLWRVADGRELHALRGGQTGPLNAVAFSADGKTVAAGGQHSALWLWDVATGRAVRPIPGHHNEVRLGSRSDVLLEGSRLALPPDTVAITACPDEPA